MPFNAIESINGFITHDTISTASDFLDEDESGIARALSGGIPALLNGIINISANSPENVFELVKQSSNEFIPEELMEIFGGNNSSMINFGAMLLSFLFGSKASTLSNLVAGYAGIKPSSGNTLMTSLVPIVFGVIGIHVITNNLDVQGLRRVLNSQRDQVHRALPSELNLPGLWVDIAATNLEVEIPATPQTPRWAIPVLVLVLVAALSFYFRSCNLPKTAMIIIQATNVPFPQDFFSS